jgi:hypothetical protein
MNIIKNIKTEKSSEFHNFVMATTEELQFIAGFIDGDGCISLNTPSAHDKTPSPTLQIRQSRDSNVPEELLFIQGLFGGSIVKKEGNDVHRDCEGETSGTRS